MNNLIPVMKCLNNFRLHSNSYKYLSFGALIFLIWQVTFALLIKNFGGNIVNNKILITFAITVFLIGVIILFKAFWDFIQVVIKNKFKQERVNKPIWLYDSLLILYILGCVVLNFISK